MPPGEASKRLPVEAVEAIRAWIDAGARWTEEKSAGAWGTYKEEDLWAFRPLRKITGGGIDEFIQAKLKLGKLTAAPMADRRTLIRRVTFDLTGLPPTPEEVAAFVKDRSPDAWSKVIDRLLASPRYGEHWGRHWLDVVRYADSSGYSNDFERPNAWRYRDYVIRAFNNDKPYDRFVREQIAGDELYPGDPEALIATGFLRAGPWEHTAMSVEAVTRQMFLDDVTNAVGVTFLGITTGCARCHDHKFDPIPTRDYYRLQAVFATTEFARPPLPFLLLENTADLPGGRARVQTIVKTTEERLRSFGDVKQLAGEQYERMKLFQKHLQLYKESLDRYEPKAFVVSSGPLDGFTDGGPALRYPKRESYKETPVHILPGGNVQSPGEKVSPGVPELLARYGSYASPSMPEDITGRRAALAKRIADAQNPLTARVMVNRVWQYHFGKGIAADSNNFGKMGRKPTHPELLDWLASEFIRSGWSVKSIHRMILLSESYRRASAHPDSKMVASVDPANDYLSYFPPRRIEAEVLRDSILAVSAQLSADAGGPGTFPQINEDVARQPLHRMGSLAPAYQPSATRRERNRRTIYTFQQRSLIDPMIEVFNGANPDLSCERRETSTVPTQAFSLLNGQFVNDMALAFALRAEKEAAADRRVDRMFQLAYGREPDAQERRVASALVAKTLDLRRRNAPPAKAAKKPLVHMITSELTGERVEFRQQEDPSEYEDNVHPSDVSSETRALAALALALFNSNEFVYVY